MCWLNYVYSYSQIFKDVSAIIQSIIVSVGVIGGGVWAYYRFYKQRQIYPRANLSHEIFHKILADGKILLQLQVKITNVGSVIISINKCDIRIQKIIPISEDIISAIKNSDDSICTKGKDRLDCEIRWPVLEEFEHQCEDGYCEIEPDESEQFCYDFIVNSDIKTVSVYSYYINISVKAKKELGWSLTTIYDLK